MNLRTIAKRLTACPGCHLPLKILPSEENSPYDPEWFNEPHATIYCDSAGCGLCRGFQFAFTRHPSRKGRQFALSWDRRELESKIPFHKKLINLVFKDTDKLSGRELTDKLKQNYERIMVLF